MGGDERRRLRRSVIHSDPPQRVASTNKKHTKSRFFNEIPINSCGSELFMTDDPAGFASGAPSSLEPERRSPPESREILNLRRQASHLRSVP